MSLQKITNYILDMHIFTKVDVKEQRKIGKQYKEQRLKIMIDYIHNSRHDSTANNCI